MAYCLEPFLVVLDFLEFILALLLRSVLDSLFLFTSPIWYFLEAFQGASHHQKIFNTVLITGASGGIGRALAIELATINPNITLYLLGRNDDRLMETKQMCQNAMKQAANPNGSDDQSGRQGSVDCYVVDNREREEVSRIITECDDKRPIDLFIANAGMGTIQTQHNDWFERYQEMVDNNIIGTFNTVFPIMKRYAVSVLSRCNVWFKIQSLFLLQCIYIHCGSGLLREDEDILHSMHRSLPILYYWEQRLLSPPPKYSSDSVRFELSICFHFSLYISMCCAVCVVSL